MKQLKASGLFQLLLIGVGLVGLISATSYNPQARLIPMALSILLILLMALLFLQENVPAAAKHLWFMGQSGLFAGKEKQSQCEDREEKEQQEYRKLFRLLLWLVAFTAMLGFVTYLITVPLFLLLFIRIEGGQTWQNAAYASAGMGVFNYLLFDLLLKTSL